MTKFIAQPDSLLGKPRAKVMEISFLAQHWKCRSSLLKLNICCWILVSWFCVQLTDNCMHVKHNFFNFYPRIVELSKPSSRLKSFSNSFKPQKDKLGID